MSKENEIIKGATGYFLANLFNRGLGFIFIILATRILGSEGYGLIALGITVLGLVSKFGMFGMTFSAQKFLSGTLNENKESLFGSMIILNLIMSIVFFIILFFGSQFIAKSFFNKPQFSIVLRVIGIAILFRLPLNLVRAILKAQKKVKLFFYINLVQSSLKIISLFIIFILSDKLLAVSLSILFSALVSLSLGIFFIIKEKINPNFKNFKYNLLKISRIGFEFLIVGLGYYLAGQIDRLMLGRLEVAKSLGIYAVASSIARIPGILHNSMISVFMPVISELYKKKKLSEVKENYYFANIFIALINILIFVGFVIIGDSGLKLLFNLDSKIVYYVFCLLSIRFILGTLVGPTGALLNMADRHKVEFFNTILLIVLNIILNFFWIKAYGVYGAVFATLISTFTLNIIQIIEIYKFYDFFVLRKIHLYLIISTLFIVTVYFKFIYGGNFFNKVMFWLLSEVTIISVFWIKIDNKNKKKLINFIGENLS